MKITKLGHCALVLEDKGVKILIDPGMFTVEAQGKQTGLAAILITHEHADHLHVESVAALLQSNPGIRVISNSAVAKILKEKDIVCEVIGGGQSGTVNGLAIEGFGHKHSEIFGNFPDVENTGYFVAEKFYFPGDSFYNPGKPVDVLALPIAGPWMRLKEAIEYAMTIKPRTSFPVHDGVLVEGFRARVGEMTQSILGEQGIGFVALKDGETREF